MWRPRLTESARMKYLGIVEALETDVRSGRVARGERLPAQRAIAEALSVDLTTVTRAFNEARRRGLVEAQAGRGSFISEKPEADRRFEPSEPLIDLSMNIPPQPAAADLRKAVSQGISDLLGGARGLLSLHYSRKHRRYARSPCCGGLARPEDRGRIGQSHPADERGSGRALRGLRTASPPGRRHRCRSHDLSRSQGGGGAEGFRRSRRSPWTSMASFRMLSRRYVA